MLDVCAEYVVMRILLTDVPVGEGKLDLCQSPSKLSLVVIRINEVPNGIVGRQIVDTMRRCHSGNGFSGFLVAHRPLMNRKSRRDIIVFLLAFFHFLEETVCKTQFYSAHIVLAKHPFAR